MRQAKYRFFLLPLFLVLVCVGVFAQTGSEVTGIITDQTGAAVAGAKITLTDPATGVVHTSISGTTGLYDIPGLTPANYDLRATAKGFEAFAQTGIVVNVSATFRVDVKLTVGAESQTVTVEADALAVQSDSNVISTLITSEDINLLATENRNVVALAALGLGVSNSLPDGNNVDSVGSSFAISFNGLNQAHNIYLIDGGESYDRGSGGKMAIMPSMDAIAEFQVLASNYPPDYGISSGGTVSMSLKSGTRKLHGTLYEENRTTDFDASRADTKAKTETHYNIFGGNVGGPVLIPHVYGQGKQKTFFFLNEEWRKVIAAGSTTQADTLAAADFPTTGTNLAYVSPAFLASPLTLKIPTLADPAWQTKLNANCAAFGAACVGGVVTQGAAMPVIPSTMFDANAVLYLNSGIIPKPNGTGANVGQNIASVPNPLNVRDDVVRIDHNFNDKWSLMGHYIHDNVAATANGPFNGWTTYNFSTIQSVFTNPSYAAVIKLTGSITPNLLLEAAINYDGNKINIGENPVAYRPTTWAVNPVTGAFPLSCAGCRTVFPGVSNYGGPYLGSNGKSIGEDTSTAPYHNASEDYEPKVDISYTQGKHAFKFGIDYNRYVKNQIEGGDSQGLYSQGGLTGSSGDGLMDMLMGITANYQQAQATPILHYYANSPSAYANDNWHVTPRLTLQLGLRYDAYPHAVERNNKLANFVPADYVSDPNLAPGGSNWVANGASIKLTAPGVVTRGTGASAVPFYLNGVELAGVNGVPKGLVKNDYNTLQPRIGFSEDLFGNGKTVLRGGFGVFYERVQLNDIMNGSGDTPFANNLSLNNVYFTNPGTSTSTGAVVSPTTLPVFVTGETTLTTTYKAPGVAQYSLGVQHQLAPSVIWVVQYVGNVGWHQDGDRKINNFPVNTPMAVRCANGDPSNNIVGGGDAACATLAGTYNSNAYVNYPGFGGITQQENDLNTGYNSFQTGLRVQNRWGLSGEVDYTYSHEIDVVSTDENLISNPWNPRYDRGSGSLDRRQIFSMNYVYKLPFFAKDKGLVHSVAGGWEISGTVIDESGVPQVPALGNNGVSGKSFDTIGLGGGYANRPNITGKMTYPKKHSEWFDITKLSEPTPAWLGGPNLGFGSAGKDAIVGPGRVDFTTSLYKVFDFTHGVNFRLNFESFNTFNHPQWGGVNTAADGSGGGVTGNFDPRNLQLGGRLTF